MEQITYGIKIDTKTYGENILLKMARERMNLSPIQVADALNISDKQYRNMENGTSKIQQKYKKKLSEFLNIDEDLLEINEGNIIISGNSIQTGSAYAVNNNFGSELIQKQLEDERLMNQKLREQILLLEEQIRNSKV